jgi:preprotein translocase subunit SecF
VTAVDDHTSAAAPEPAPARAGASIWHRLYHGETTFDFVGRRRIGFIISGVLILLSVLSLSTRGLNLGIDFEGGVAWEFQSNGQTVDNARDVLSANGINPVDAKIQVLSGTDGQRLRVQVGDQSTATQTKVKEAFAKATNQSVDNVSVNVVSATWGSQITKKAVRALIVFFILLTIYISIRFEWRMAIAAFVAVVHDLVISVGVYSIFGFEVTPATVIAFLTILGFSLYDTIVVFDKVHENSRAMVTSRASYDDVVNKSMNQVLMRSINTSLAAVLPVLSLLIVGVKILGAVALEDFSLALLVGLIAGSYSSIFVATPVLAMLKGKGKSRGRPAAGGRPARTRPAATPVTNRSSASVSPALEPKPNGDAEPEAPERETSTPPRPTPTPPPTPAAVKPAALTHAPRPRKKRRR